jgi:hypothetical protein
MWRDYRVTAPGHIHAGKPLAVGDVVRLRPALAARYPATFAPIAAPAVRQGAATDTRPPAPRRAPAFTHPRAPRDTETPAAPAAALPNPPQE